MKTIFTIGYTGLQIDEFMQHLLEASVEMLLDVREIPISRKRGFSKNALAEKLVEFGIQYHHFKWLGSPKVLRHEVRETRDYSTFFGGVTRHLRQPLPVVQVQEAVQLARKGHCCLMCCCEDWQLCHRRCVVDEMLRKQHFTVKHLSVPVISKAKRRTA